MTEKNYQVETHEGYTLLKLGERTISDQKLFDLEIDALTSSVEGSLFVDCDKVTSLSKEWVRSLLRLQISLKTNDKSFKLIHANKTFQNFLRDQGLFDTFKISSSVSDAQQEGKGKAKRTLNTEFINPFLDATMHVLKIQAGLEVRPGKIFMKKAEDNLTGDISGIIGIVSDAFNGSVIICFPEATFLKVISGMLGEDFTEITQDIIDGAGELTNMIFGQAKVVLNQKGYGIKTAIPSVITGKDHTTTASDGPVVVVPFSGEAGNFVVEICIS